MKSLMRRINSIVAKNQPHRLGLNFGDPLRNKKNIIVSNVSRSLKVVGNGGIQLAIYDFLLVSPLCIRAHESRRSNSFKPYEPHMPTGMSPLVKSNFVKKYFSCSLFSSALIYNFDKRTTSQTSENEVTEL